ncbi:hypothetical protein ACR776_09270 [Sphingobacterium spiritivorum]|uniref:hypothetical protein n=1 Tax=Sphingobacterium spiritivorum TaxID=258 RepID=UPI003DA3FDF9
MKKSHIVILAILLVPCLLMLFNDRGISNTIKDNIVFKQKLSEYGLYKGKMSDLTPCNEAVTIEIASPLFTDYAEKQRIILLPKGFKMKAQGSGLPDFPNGTIIAKTFYYQNKTNGKAETLHILETRLLIKNEDQWNASTYQWNDIQDEAFLLKDGATVPVAFVEEMGNNRTTSYKIPSRTDCISCHRQNDQILPIGPKLRNMNININLEQEFKNQLEYLKEKGKLEITDNTQITQITDYRNEAEPLQMRARAYLDINCAHCHNPNGTGYITQLDLRTETPIHETGIWLKQGKIAYRMTVTGDLHMPKIGTTIPHDEGVKLILDYMKNLE